MDEFILRKKIEMKLLIATTNAGKIKEFREMLGDDRYEWTDLRELGSLKDVDETGSTFRANACLKASAYATHFNQWALADDSGLEVEALGNKPGVHSARWAKLHNAGQGDADNNKLLLQQLALVREGKRSARFVCVLALSDPSGKVILTARDTVEGKILTDPRGQNGFGYDPLFHIDSLGKTTAELTPDEKHAISHRGKALRTMRKLMDGILLQPA